MEDFMVAAGFTVKVYLGQVSNRPLHGFHFRGWPKKAMNV
jgi:hypothetical protein